VAAALFEEAAVLVVDLAEVVAVRLLRCMVVDVVVAPSAEAGVVVAREVEAAEE
jgi:hypothetical protein